MNRCCGPRAKPEARQQRFIRGLDADRQQSYLNEQLSVVLIFLYVKKVLITCLTFLKYTIEYINVVL